jgi:hypothetical protein
LDKSHIAAVWIQIETYEVGLKNGWGGKLWEIVIPNLKFKYVFYGSLRFYRRLPFEAMDVGRTFRK